MLGLIKQQVSKSSQRMRLEQRYGVQDFWGRMGWCLAPVPRSIFMPLKNR
jgi:hypothetical protein